MAIADVKAVSPTGQILGSYKWADPDLLNLSMGQAITPGLIGDAARKIVCDERFRTPLVDKGQLASMSSQICRALRMAVAKFTISQ